MESDFVRTPCPVNGNVAQSAENELTIACTEADILGTWNLKNLIFGVINLLKNIFSTWQFFSLCCALGSVAANSIDRRQGFKPASNR
jgi:hypothetical protein